MTTMENQDFFSGEISVFYDSFLQGELEAMCFYESLAQHFMNDHDFLYAFSAFYLELSGIHRQRAARLIALAHARGWPFSLFIDFELANIKTWVSPLDSMDDALRIEEQVRFGEQLLQIHFSLPEI